MDKPNNDAGKLSVEERLKGEASASGLPSTSKS